jgi:hypothetical protein
MRIGHDVVVTILGAGIRIGPLMGTLGADEQLAIDVGIFGPALRARR